MLIKNYFIIFLTIMITFFPEQLICENKRPFKLNIGVGITRNEPVIFSEISYKEKMEIVPLLKISIGYELFRNFNASVYGGYSYQMRIREKSYEKNENNEVIAMSVGRTNSNTFFYGVKADYQLMPALMQSNRAIRFDLYPTITLGGVTHFWHNRYGGGKTFLKPVFECSIGMGAGYKFTRRFGIYAEYAFGHFHYDTHHRIDAGISFYF